MVTQTAFGERHPAENAGKVYYEENNYEAK